MEIYYKRLLELNNLIENANDDTKIYDIVFPIDFPKILINHNLFPTSKIEDDFLFAQRMMWKKNHWDIKYKDKYLFSSAMLQIIIEIVESYSRQQAEIFSFALDNFNVIVEKDRSKKDYLLEMKKM